MINHAGMLVAIIVRLVHALIYPNHKVKVIAILKLQDASMMITKIYV